MLFRRFVVYRYRMTNEGCGVTHLKHRILPSTARYLIAMFLSVLGLGFTASLLTASAASAAPTCSTSGHCYMLAELDVSSPDAFHGQVSPIEATCLSVSNPSSNFDTAETWMSNTTVDDYWIESGIAYGDPEGASTYFYWADDRPGSGYYEHDDTTDSVTAATYYNSEMSVDTSTSYDVSMGPFYGVSSGWPSGYSFYTLQTGSETSDGATAASILASSDSLYYYNASNVLTYEWSYGANDTYAHTVPSTWGTITTVTANNHYRYNTVTSC